MSLQVWLPLNGDLHNQGLSGLAATNNNATVNNNGKIGKCYQLGTAASDISLPAAAMTSYTTECSISFWINILTWNTSYDTFFQAGPVGTAWTTYIFGFLRNAAASTSCCFTISNGSSASNASYLTPALDLNKWYHISLVYKTGHCLIYINGSLYRDYATSIVPNFTKITTIKIGRATNGNYQSNCLMNDFRIYDHAISAAEVAEIAKGLVLHYKLNDLSYGQTIYDCSGYNNDGTVVGSLTAAAGSPRYQVATYMDSPSPTDNSATGEYYIAGECDLSLVSNISISWWMYPEQGYRNYLNDGILCTTANNIGSDYTTSAFNHYDGQIRINASDGNYIRVSTSSFVKNAWHYYTLTFDGLTAKLYKDGVLQANSAFSENKTLRNFTKILIGHSRAGSVHRKIKGKYSDFRIYTTTLTPEQILNLYNTSISIDNSGNTYARELKEV